MEALVWPGPACRTLPEDMAHFWPMRVLRAAAVGSLLLGALAYALAVLGAQWWAPPPQPNLVATARFLLMLAGAVYLSATSYVAHRVLQDLASPQTPPSRPFPPEDVSLPGLERWRGRGAGWCLPGHQLLQEEGVHQGASCCPLRHGLLRRWDRLIPAVSITGQCPSLWGDSSSSAFHHGCPAPLKAPWTITGGKRWVCSPFYFFSLKFSLENKRSCLLLDCALILT